MLFEVRKTIGSWLARTVPSSGMETWYSESTSKQQGLGLELDPVHLVDQQHHRLLGPDGLEQRPGQEEVLGEDVLLELLPGGGVAAPAPASSADPPSPSTWPAWMRSSCLR